jgi:hypothetical protein
MFAEYVTAVLAATLFAGLGWLILFLKPSTNWR